MGEIERPPAATGACSIVGASWGWAIACGSTVFTSAMATIGQEAHEEAEQGEEQAEAADQGRDVEEAWE